jgi:hypothetical protein
MRKTNDIILAKIPLGPFIEMLMNAYGDGAMFVDLVGAHTMEQDVIGILIRENYFTPAPKEVLTKEDLNQLI